MDMKLYNDSMTTIASSFDATTPNYLSTMVKNINNLLGYLNDDVNEENYGQFVFQWRQLYKLISRTSRSCKLFRKTNYIKANFPEIENPTNLSCRRAMDALNLKIIANKMLRIRQDRKDEIKNV